MKFLFYYRVIKCIILPPAGRTNPFFPPPPPPPPIEETKACAKREKHLFYTCEQYTIVRASGRAWNHQIFETKGRRFMLLNVTHALK